MVRWRAVSYAPFGGCRSSWPLPRLGAWGYRLATAPRACRIPSIWEFVEIGGYVGPVVDASEADGGDVVRRGVEEAAAFKALEVAGQVVDEILGAENGLVAAEDVVGGRDEQEVALQPAILGAERVGYGHGLGGDENVEAFGQVLQDLLRTGHQWEVFEKVLGIEEGAHLLLTVGGRHLPQALA